MFVREQLGRRGLTALIFGMKAGPKVSPVMIRIRSGKTCGTATANPLGFGERKTTIHRIQQYHLRNVEKVSPTFFIVDQATVIRIFRYRANRVT